MNGVGADALTRRRLLARAGLLGLSAAGTLLAACQQASPAAPTLAGRPTGAPAAAPSPMQGAPQPTQGGESASGSTSTVRVGDLQITSGAGYYIAQDKAYFREQALSLDLQKFTTGGEQIPVLATGQLDIGVGAVSAALFNAIARGVPIKAVADHGSSLPGRSAGSLSVRKDLIESGAFKDYADLKGRSIAVASLDSSSEVQLVRALARANLTLDDMRVTVLSFPDMAAAFASKAIDAAIYQEPFTTRSIEAGLVVRWKGADEYYPNQQVAVLMLSPAFAAKQDLAKRFVLAYLRGVRDYVDAFDKGVGKDEVVTILTRYTAIKERPLYDKMVPSGLQPDGRINVESLKQDLDYYVKKGVVTGTVDLTQLVDTSYIEHALGQLGPYQK